MITLAQNPSSSGKVIICHTEYSKFPIDMESIVTIEAIRWCYVHNNLNSDTEPVIKCKKREEIHENELCSNYPRL